MLFNNASKVSRVDTISFQRFGKTVKRLKNVEEMSVVFIGIESINEVYQHYSFTEESEFEVTAKYIKSHEEYTLESYIFPQKSKTIRV